MIKNNKLRIGTRSSALALEQTNLFIHNFLGQYPSFLQENIEICPIKTTGDASQKSNQSLIDMGGKALFCKEIEEHLADDKIDIAIHSLKDVPTDFDPLFHLPCVLERDDSRDAFLSFDKRGFEDLLEGATLGTSSVRRKAYALSRRPDLNIVPFRGNVDSRLKKLQEKIVDATFLSYIGLKRLGLEENVAEILSVEESVPAVGQGAVVIECLKSREDLKELLQPLNHTQTAACVNAERALLATLDGSCHTAIGGHAFYTPKNELKLIGVLYAPTGDTLYRSELLDTSSDPISLGQKLGYILREESKFTLDPPMENFQKCGF